MTEENAHVAHTGAPTPSPSPAPLEAAAYAPAKGEGANVAQGFLSAFAIVALLLGAAR